LLNTLNACNLGASQYLAISVILHAADSLEFAEISLQTLLETNY